MSVINGNPNPEARAAQLYDLLMDEMRVFKPTVQESEMALCMALASYLGGTCNSDTEASMAIKRIGQRLEGYYERHKQIAERQREQERIQLDTKDFK